MRILGHVQDSCVIINRLREGPGQETINNDGLRGFFWRFLGLGGKGGG